MSRVMYNYRLPKARWWDFARECRSFYAEKHPISAAVTKAAVSAAGGSTETRVDTLARMLDVIRKADEWMVDRGYMFLNNHERWVQGFGLEPVFYDDRSDVPPELEKNRAVSLWCDDKVTKGEYLLYQVLTEDGLSEMVISTIMG